MPDPESTNVDLSIYLGVGDGKLDPSRKPAFRRQGFVLDWPLLAVESKGKGSLVIVSGCGGCSNDYSTTLTIVYRGGEFLVGGYTYEWETRESAGTCDINFLTGKGTMLEGIEGDGKPLAGTFTPVKLADWSDDTRPKACDCHPRKTTPPASSSRAAQLGLGRPGKRERAGLDLAGGDVGADRHAGRRRRRIDELHRRRHGALAEQPLAGTQHQRKVTDPEFVDQVVGKQRLDQLGAALDQHVGASPCFSFAIPAATSPRMATVFFQ